MENRRSFLVLEPKIQENCLRVNDLAASVLIDQPELGKKIRRALMCSAEDARRAIAEAIKFVWLAASNDDGKLTPSHRVDLAWHELILFTRAYHEFCDQQFGKFVHHQPGGAVHENRQQFAKTLRLYQDAFGAPPQDFWGSHEETTAACGTCETKGE